MLQVIRTEPQEAPEPRRMVLRSGQRTFFVFPWDIDWVEAAGNYSRVHFGAVNVLVRELITSLELRLRPHGFLRTHRSTLVNIARVLETRRHGNRKGTVVLVDGTLVRANAENLEELERLLAGSA